MDGVNNRIKKKLKNTKSINGFLTNGCKPQKTWVSCSGVHPSQMVSSDQANATSNHKYSIRLTCHFKVFISKKLATEFFVAQNMSAYFGSHFNIQNVKNSMSWNNTASTDAAGCSE